MIPVDQEFLHNPEKDIKGDCFRASIASILELPIKEVPHFCANEDNWHKEFQEWLAERGYCFFEVAYMPQEHFKYLNVSECYHTLVGPSPRFPGERHCVVGKNGQIVFDPHADRSGLAGKPEEWLTGFIVSLCNREQNHIRRS